MEPRTIVSALGELCGECGWERVGELGVGSIGFRKDQELTRFVWVVSERPTPDEIKRRVADIDASMNGAYWGQLYVLDSHNLKAAREGERVILCSYYELVRIITGLNIVPYLDREREAWQRCRVDLRSFVSLRFREEGQNLGVVGYLRNRAREDDERSLQICYGEYGSGKSTALLELEDVLAADYLEDPVHRRIPIRLNLMEFRHNQRIEDMVKDAVCGPEEQFLSKTAFWKMVEAGRFIFLLDAVDEMGDLYAPDSDKIRQVRELLRLHFRGGDVNREFLSRTRSIWTCRTTYFEDYEEVGGKPDVQGVLERIPGASKLLILAGIEKQVVEHAITEGALAELVDQVYGVRELCELPLWFQIVLRDLSRLADESGPLLAFDVFDRFVAMGNRRERVEKGRDLDEENQTEIVQSIACLSHDRRRGEVRDRGVSWLSLLEQVSRYIKARGLSEKDTFGMFTKVAAQLRLCSFMSRYPDDRSGYYFYPQPFEFYFVAKALWRAFELRELKVSPLVAEKRFEIEEGVRRFLSEAIFDDRRQRSGGLAAGAELREDGWVRIPEGLMICRDEFAQGGREGVELCESFYVKRAPVTRGEYREYLAANISSVPPPVGWETPEYDQICPTDDCPVIGIRYEHADGYCKWLSARKKRHITLPTDKQWQRIARGREGRLYHWGLTAPTNPESICNGLPYWQNQAKDSNRRTTPVGQFGESKDLMCDVIGNVWEWTTAEDGYSRSLRGASFHSKPDQWVLSSTDANRGCRLLLSMRPEELKFDDLKDVGFRPVEL